MTQDHKKRDRKITIYASLCVLCLLPGFSGPAQGQYHKCTVMQACGLEGTPPTSDIRSDDQEILFKIRYWLLKLVN